MSYQDRLKNSQRGGNFSDAPKLTISYSMDVREHTQKPGTIAFSFWDKGEEEGAEKVQKFVSKPITGVYMGSAFVIKAFSDDIGTKGGTYYTSYYFKNTDIVTLMKPGRDGRSEKCFSGNIEGVKSFLVNSRCQPKVIRCLYVLTNAGLVKIETNTTIAIDQMNKIEKELATNKLVLTPCLYDPETKTISKRGKEFLSKLAAKNPPKYAELSLGSPITDQEATDWNLDAALDEYIAWKEFKESKDNQGKTTETDHPDPSVTRQADKEGNASPYLNNGGRLGMAQQSAPEEESDLPF